MHGSAQQAVQITQVMTATPTRALDIGNVHIEFHVKQGLANTPLTQMKGLAAPLCVSSPEATALDLVSFQQSVGGVARAADVVAGLLPAMTTEGWRRALHLENIAVKQRMGYVLEVLGAQKYAKLVEASMPAKLRQVRLQSTMPSLGTDWQMPWQVEDNIRLKESMN
jgi:predicted transcriptional regulator of viral defense system